MNQKQNDINTPVNNGITNNQPLNSSQNIQQPVTNKSTKKKKYWLIPVFVFITMILAPIISMVLNIFEVNNSIISSIFTIIFVICGFAVIPSIIVAVILSNKNK